MSRLEYLSDHVGLYCSGVTVGVIRDGDRGLLIDCDDGTVVDALEADHGLDIQRAAFTHYHRDSAGGVHSLARRDVDLTVPAAEEQYFADVESFWTDPDFRFRRYESFRPHPLLLARSVPVDATLDPGETIEWGDATITALSTPGHTEHGLSYRVDVDGRRYAFVGDVICSDGCLWDLYSLQHSTTELTDYHSFLGERDRLIDGLENLIEDDPDVLVPLRDGTIQEPAAAVERLARRLRAAYANYVKIAALRHYFPHLFADEEPPDAMPIREGTDPPKWLRHVGTSWLLRSADGPGLLMDCGSEAVVEQLQAWEDAGDINGIEGLWISHYHYDHMDAVGAFEDEYDAPIMAQEEVADVLERPSAYRLPVLSSDAVPIDRRLADGESWQWREWTLTAYWFPGQTYHHGGLLAEGHDLRLLLAGDAFTMAGIDDYCTRNRNLIGESRGFDRCVRLVEDLDPTHICNCHVERTFSFTPTEIETMRETLADRVEIFGDLLHWEHPNFGLDPDWVRCDPYYQSRIPGDRARFGVVVTNHASAVRTVAVRPRPPSAAWDPRGRSDPGWIRLMIDPQSTETITLPLRVPADVTPGMVVIPVDVRWNGRQFPRFREALVAVES